METASNACQQARVVRVVRNISSTPITAQAIREKMIDTRLPVAAYARVSTTNEEQEDSLERQKAHYTEYIGNRPEWRFVGVYDDPGVTGTRADQRKGFQKLLADCRAGKIKKILCKSISRFARNTVDALQYIRELKELGVGVYFETQNIDTMTAGGDILITILAAIAEQESRNMSENIKWAFQKKFKEGEVMLACSQFLGYDRDKDKNIVINEEQAKVVRRIYREFLSGYACSAIAKRLTEDGIPTPTGKKQWRTGVIQSILTNEKYYGCAYLGKTCKRDVLSKERVASEEVYYVENSHPAIIQKDTWDLVQLEMARRQEYRTCSETGNGKYSSKYPFSKKLICGECGMIYRRHAQFKKGKYVRTWVCITHKRKGNEYCSQHYILEDDIEKAFQMVLNELVGDMGSIKEILQKNVVEALGERDCNSGEQVLMQIQCLQTEMIDINRKKRSGEIAYETYVTRAREIADQVEVLEKQQREIRAAEDNRITETKRIKDILETINEVRPTDEFDGEIFRRLIDNVIIKDKRLTFNFKVGISKSTTI